MTDVEQILAIESIKQLKARYFRCLDKKDWAGFLAVFTPDATVDTTEAFTPTDHTGAPMNVGGAAPAVAAGAYDTDIVKFVANLSQMLGPVSTVHHGHMPEIELITPTTAKATWSMEDMLRYPGPPVRELHGFGHYEETYEHLAAGWRIKTLKLTRLRIDTGSH